MYEPADDMMDQYPMLDDLSKEDFEVLQAIKTVNDIKTVEMEAEWSDDHCPCVGVVINGVKCSFWWLVREYAAAFEYANDSARAKKRVFEVVSEGVANADRSE